jgi:hypothetical protein
MPADPTGNKFASRKLLIALLTTLIAVALPIIYHQIGIESGVTMTVLGIIGAVSSFYFGANVLEKKLTGE